MRHIDLDVQDTTVRRFILSLSAEPDGSVLESKGRPVVWVLAPAPGTNDGDGAWTDEKNARRCQLIDWKYERGLTSTEAAELASLQAQMLRYRQKVAPLPLEEARRLHQELLKKAAKASATDE